MAAETDPIPIIGGTGALGYGLAVRWARAGRRVVIGSRVPERAAEAAERVRTATGRYPTVNRETFPDIGVVTPL